MIVHLITSWIDAAPATPSVPDFGTGTPPPGSAGLLTIGKWIAWVATGMSVVGLMTVGGRMASEWHDGQMSQHGKRLSSVLAGIILIGSASGIAAGILQATGH